MRKALLAMCLCVGFGCAEDPVEVDTESAAVVVTCTTDADCKAANEYCLGDVAGICPDDKEFTGTCAAVPGGCTTVYDPVCGCDGVTYSNSCLAAMAKQNVAHTGPCK